jgi:hypothetical protein
MASMGVSTKEEEEWEGWDKRVDRACGSPLESVGPKDSLLCLEMLLEGDLPFHEYRRKSRPKE